MKAKFIRGGRNKIIFGEDGANPKCSLNIQLLSTFHNIDGYRNPPCFTIDQAISLTEKTYQIRWWSDGVGPYHPSKYPSFWNYTRSS